MQRTKTKMTWLASVCAVAALGNAWAANLGDDSQSVASDGRIAAAEAISATPRRQDDGRTRFWDGSRRPGEGLLSDLTAQRDTGAHAIDQMLDGVEYVSGRILVGLSRQRDKQGRLRALSSLRDVEEVLPGRVRRFVGDKTERPVAVLELPEGLTVRDALKMNLRAVDRRIEFVQPDLIVRVTTNDPMYPNLWALNNTGQEFYPLISGTEDPIAGALDADIDASEGWQTRTDASSVIVAVIDSGVDYTHPDLAANMWVNDAEANGTAGVDDDNNGYVDDVYGYDFCTIELSERDSDPMDEAGHGTHCAGTIGAVGNNGVGVCGVAQTATIMAVRFLSGSGSGSLSDAADAVYYAVDNGAKVLSNSWGGLGVDTEGVLHGAFEYAHNNGVLIVAAAGNIAVNTDLTHLYPASFALDSIVSVAATDWNDQLAWFSSWGPTTVELGAPGHKILSTLPVWDDEDYGFYSGTSMATPHVSGAAALVWAEYPSLTNLQVKERLMRVDPLPGLLGKTISGGRLNLQKALFNGTITSIHNKTEDTYHTTIQQAINVAFANDVIVVNPGTYYETIVFGNTPITLRSLSPTDALAVDMTIIDGGGTGPVVTFTGNETGATVLAGITLTNGDAGIGIGGGICGNGTLARVERCRIVNCQAANGAGIGDCDGDIAYCLVESNTAQTNGGGMFDCDGTIVGCDVVSNNATGGGGLASCDATILRSKIADNVATSDGGGLLDCESQIAASMITGNVSGGVGGGLHSNGYNVVLEHATVASNSAATSGGGISIDQSNAAVTMSHSIVWENTAASDAELSLTNGASATVSYSDIKTVGPPWPGVGNINADPAFVAVSERDYHLQVSSACIDAGDIQYQSGANDLDVDEQEWSADGDCDGTLRIDIGADEKYVSFVNADGSADFTTIGQAIAAADDVAHEVVVADGIYTGPDNRDLDFAGKAIVVRSANGPNGCVIDCEHLGAGAIFYRGEDARAVFDGFTIINGYTEDRFGEEEYAAKWFVEDYGGGIGVYRSSPTIRNCILIDNEAYFAGGAIAVGGDCAPLIQNCVMSQNSALLGGGVSTSRSNPYLVNCTIVDNSGEAGGGGGVFLEGASNLELTNSIVASNRASGWLGGDQAAMYGVNVDTINISVSYSDLLGGPDAVTRMCVFGSDDTLTVTWGDGAIATDPGFLVDGDWILRTDSPCVDAGTNSPPGGLPVQDVYGNVRPIDGDGQAGAVADMGAVESSPGTSVLAASPYSMLVRAFRNDATAGSSNITLGNGGSATLSWSASDDADWLTITPMAGSLGGGQTVSIEASVDTTGLTPGAYEATVDVHAPGALNSPRTVHVTAIVGDRITVCHDGSGDHTTIQSALDTMGPYDEVTVCPGRYYENVIFEGSEGGYETLRSVDPDDPEIVATTIIDGGGNGGGIWLTGKPFKVLLTGFTLTNGLRGVYCAGGGHAAEISNCVITGNDALGAGGGVRDFPGLITNCVIADNTAPSGGGLYKCGGRIENCIIARNSAVGGGCECGFDGGGGGLSQCLGSISNCTVVENTAVQSGGGMFGCTGVVTNCVMWGNTALVSDPQFARWLPPAFCCIQDWTGGGTGNIAGDPLFLDPETGDYRLSLGSSCIDAGSYQSAPERTDIGGQPRVIDGDGDLVTTVDIGAHEYDPDSQSLSVCSSGCGFTSIQAAINAASDGAEILVRPGTYYENVNISGKDVLIRSRDADDPAIVSATIIDGSDQGSVVTFSGTETAAELAGLTITNGDAWYDGGGICGNGAVATITKCTVTDNSADTGGGIARISGMISDCIISDNIAENHGGGTVDCSGMLNRCTVTGNSASAGGGVAWHSGDIYYCVVADNTASSRGGGLMDCTGQVRSCLIALNDGGSWGGGYMNGSGQADLNLCTIVGNTASNGGGLHTESMGTSADLASCVFWDNSGTNGPELSAEDATINVAYCDVEGGQSKVYLAGGATLSWGLGAIDQDPLFVDADGADDDPDTWQDNDYHLQAASYCINRGAPDYESSTDETDIDGETRVLHGRVDMGCHEATTLVAAATNTTQQIDFTSIQAAIDGAANGDEIAIHAGTHYETIAFDGREVVLRSTDPDDPAVVATTILDGQGAGSVVSFAGTESSSTVLSGVTITNGLSADAGGGIAGNGTLAEIRRCVITANASENAAGGIDGCDGLIAECFVTGNTGGTGGGMHGGGTVRNCVITGNHGDDAGGAVYCDTAIDILNCTIADNTADTGSAGVHGAGATVTVANSILWGNQTADAIGGPQVQLRASASLTLSYSDVDGGQNDVYVEAGSTLIWGTGNIDTDPLFVDQGNGDYHLLFDSPCVDTGDPTFTPAVGETDIDGGSRVTDGIADSVEVVDMGANELHVIRVCWDGSQDHETIAQAVAVLDGSGQDIVLCDGTYNGAGNVDVTISKPVRIHSAGGPDTCIIDGGGTSQAFTVTSGSAHVALNGLTIQNCYESGAGGANAYGGAIKVDAADTVTLVDCTLRSNTAATSNTAQGGAVYCSAGSLILDACRFYNNQAIPTTGNGWAYGGALYVGGNATTTIANAVFSGNQVESGYYNPQLGTGGAIYSSGGVSVVNSIFGHNSSECGGTVCLMGDVQEDSAYLANCTFVGNHSDDGPAVVCATMDTVVSNCLAWDNTTDPSPPYGPQWVIASGGQLTLSYCDLEGGLNDVQVVGSPVPVYTNSIESDPLLVDPDGPDDDGSTWQDNDYHLSSLSPCLDAGDPTGSYVGQTDIDGERREAGEAVEIGADEVIPSLSTTDPADDSTLAKIQNNVIWLTFDHPIALPPSGAALTIIPLAGGSDVGSSFTYSIEDSDPNNPDLNDVLKASESGAVLTNKAWYGIAPAAGLAVEAFSIDLCTLIGDATGDGATNALDMGPINAHIDEVTDGRWDIDGNGTVQQADLNEAWSRNGDLAPAKP